MVDLKLWVWGKVMVIDGRAGTGGGGQFGSR